MDSQKEVNIDVSALRNGVASQQSSHRERRLLFQTLCPSLSKVLEEEQKQMTLAMKESKVGHCKLVF